MGITAVSGLQMTIAATKKPHTPVAARHVRKGILTLHLALGFFLGLYFSLMGLTGSTLVFKNELHRLTKPSAYYVAVPANASRLPLDTLTKVFNDGHAESPLSFITLPTEPNQALIVGYKLKSGQNQKRALSMQTIIDPYTGKVVAEQLSGGWFFRTVHNLHARLLLEDFGEEVHRFAVFGIFALLLSGICLWWSTKKTSIKLDGNFKRKIFDTHNVVGFFAGGFLFVLALTACSDIWRDQTKVIVGALTGASLVAEEKSAKGSESKDKKIQPSYDAMLVTAKTALPNMVAVAITDKLRVRMVSPGGQYVIPRCMTVVCNQADGSLKTIEDPAKMPLGQQILAWMLPVHFGQWGPGITFYLVKALWFCVGLSPSILFISGVIMYVSKRRARKNKSLP